MQSALPYHVFARSNNKEWFYLASDEVWSICKTLFSKTFHDYSSRVLEFVLMSNHFHLLIETPEANLNEVMNYFMREFSRAVGRKTGRINHIFGGRYKGCLIEHAAHFAHIYKYVLRNPVEAGLSSRVEEYPFSTLKREFGQSLGFPVAEILEHPLSGYIPLEIAARMTWLNTKYRFEQAELIRQSLKRTEFKFPAHPRHASVVKTLTNSFQK